MGGSIEGEEGEEGVEGRKGSKMVVRYKWALLCYFHSFLFFCYCVHILSEEGREGGKEEEIRKNIEC